MVKYIAFFFAFFEFSEIFSKNCEFAEPNVGGMRRWDIKYFVFYAKNDQNTKHLVSTKSMTSSFRRKNLSDSFMQIHGADGQMRRWDNEGSEFVIILIPYHWLFYCF